MRNAKGFTIIELLIVMTIVGILASLAIPSSVDARRRATAQKVIGDFNVIRQAAYDQFADNSSYPRNGRWGQAPAEFVPSLPDGFELSYSGVDYRWRRWSTASGLPRNNRARALIGVQIRSNDRALIATIRRAFGGTSWGSRRRIVLVIE
jgi:prepilin-type N-terminal cleavage/methylation domain-containing protein